MRQGMLGECGCTGKRGVITLTTTTKLLLLVDGSSYLHRAYRALPPLSTSTGEPTGALYGVIAMLRKLVETYPPAYLAVIFDAPGKNFRHELFTA